MRWRSIATALLITGALCLAQAHADMVMGLAGGVKKPAGGGGANVAADVVGTKKYQATSNSFSYTGLTITGGLTNPGLVCWVMRADASNDVTVGLSLSWGAQSMTLRSSAATGIGTRGAFLFGLRNPTSGNQTLTVSATNVATDNFVNCTSFSNVNQASDAAAFPNPTGDGTGTVASISVTSASGHIAVGSFANGASNGVIIGTTVINDATSGSIINAAGDYVTSSGASTTVGTTTTQTVIAGMDISN